MALATDSVSALLAGIPLPLLLIGDDERVRALNPAAERMFGPGMTGRHFYAVLRQPSVLECIATAFDTGAEGQARFHRQDHAQETLYLVRCIPVVSPGDSGVMVSFEDVTSFETAGQMRRDFVANVSHELRTPLTAILGFIETLRGPAKNDAAARDRFLQTMEREAERMNRLITDLLALSRVEGEERVRPTERVDVLAVVRSVCLGLRPLADAAAVQLSVLDPAVDATLIGDEDQLMQVFTNLAANAIKYGGEGGQVTFAISLVDRDPVLRSSALQIDVRDDGPGIDPIIFTASPSVSTAWTVTGPARWVEPVWVWPS